MNKEYIYLSDKEMLVTDEKGISTKRNVEHDNMHDVLVLENELEKINKRVENLEKVIRHNEENKSGKIKDMMVLLTLNAVLGITAIDLLCMGGPLDFPISYTIAVASTIGVMDLKFNQYSKENIKIINEVKIELLKAYKLKNDLEQRLSKIKEKSKDMKSTNKVDLQKTNNVVVIQENYEDTSEELVQAFEKGYNQKVKRKTLNKIKRQS